MRILYLFMKKHFHLSFLNNNKNNENHNRQDLFISSNRRKISETCNNTFSSSLIGLLIITNRKLNEIFSFVNGKIFAIKKFHVYVTHTYIFQYLSKIR